MQTGLLSGRVELTTSAPGGKCSVSSSCYHVANRSYPIKAIACDSRPRVCLRKTHVSARFFWHRQSIANSWNILPASDVDRFTFAGLCYMYRREDQTVRYLVLRGWGGGQAGRMLRRQGAHITYVKQLYCVIRVVKLLDFNGICKLGMNRHECYR